jgi:glycolate oxidase iron-sulfur subunit
METHLADFIRDTPEGQEAEAILRACVHCGFCNATCPTYQLLGDELDGPRGRVYLIKQMLEGRPVTRKTQLHLDRCLNCRACETTCPSGVNYHRLADIGREVAEALLPRSGLDAAKRAALAEGLTRPALFAAAVALGRIARPLLPASLADRIPPRVAGDAIWPPPRHARRMLVLEGCVQPTLAPSINAATAHVLDALGISLIRAPKAGCCGALLYHLNAQAAALDDMRRLIGAWWPAIEAGAEAIVVTASGCGAQIADYGGLLAHDEAYAAKAARVSALARDVSLIVAAEGERLAPLLQKAAGPATAVAFQSPCSLQHALKIRGVAEQLLTAAGYRLTPVADPHLCCGSAGTYALLQPELAQRLRADKLAALAAGQPEVIATANIGCLTHLQGALPVRHWIELVAERLA